MALKIWVGRSGKSHGPYDLDEVKAGLESGEFLESDYGWVDGMEDWRDLPSVFKKLSAIFSTEKTTKKNPPKDEKWRKLEPTMRQLRFLRKREIPFPPRIRRGEAFDLIASLPESYRRLTAEEIKMLQKEGIDIGKISHSACVIRLERLKSGAGNRV